MKQKEKKVLLIGVAAFFLFLLFPNIMTGQSGGLVQAAGDLIASFEGFSPTSYWDYKQYSWGYGTKAPGAGATITESEARLELWKHIEADYAYMEPLISTSLTNNQWAALLSFSYNLGTGNADNLVQNINKQDWAALENQWKQYVNAGGVYNQGLADRRAAEWQYFIS
jgi:lysozyme